jgi:hypothetical protein
MFAKRAFQIVLVAGVVVLAVGVGKGTAGTARALRVAQQPGPAGVTIPYSGRLTDEGGQPVGDGAYDFTFALYDAPEGGTLLWPEAQTSVAVQGGAFTAAMGSVSPLPAGAQERGLWLEVGVRGPEEAGFTLLSPRQALSVAASVGTAIPSAGPAYAHDHLGESWVGAYTPGLTVADTTTNGTGIEGVADTGSNAWGVYGTSAGGRGVYGHSTSGVGVWGESSSRGVYGTSTSDVGVWGQSGSNTGVAGKSTSGVGVWGESTSDWAGYFVGDVAQSRTSDGLVKAGVFSNCYGGLSVSSIIRSFSNVGGTITVFSGANIGLCTLNFGFQIDDRYFVATATSGKCGLLHAWRYQHHP